MSELGGEADICYMNSGMRAFFMITVWWLLPWVHRMLKDAWDLRQIREGSG